MPVGEDSIQEKSLGSQTPSSRGSGRMISTVDRARKKKSRAKRATKKRTLKRKAKMGKHT